MRLVKFDYSKYNGQPNMNAALKIFYAVALTHALLFLIEKACWKWTVSYLKITEKVREECGFGRSGVVSLRRFFHEAYWKLNKGCVFHAIDLDLITFAQGLLISCSRSDQLIAVRILNGLIFHEKISHETHRRIRTSTETICGLVKMLSWHDQGDKAIRLLAAKIVAVVASDLNVEEIQGALDCICSLFKQEDPSNEKTIEQNLLGLEILTNLSGNPINCLKITEKLDLLLKIVDFTLFNTHTLDNKETDEFTIVVSSLVLLKNIVNTKGKRGQIIRRDVNQISIVSNLRAILKYGGTDPVLFTLMIEILAALSMDEAARNKIGSTIGIIRPLLSSFLKLFELDNDRKFWSKAGDALVALTQQSKLNCCKILENNSEVVQMLIIICFTKDLYRSTNAMKILRNICTLSGTKWHDNLRQVITALPWVLMIIVSPTTAKESLEASIGLCVQICKFTTIEEFTRILSEVDVYTINFFVQRLLTILENNICPNAQFPCLRRDVIELIIWIAESNDPLIKYLKEAELEGLLVHVAENATEFENYYYFSENFGVMKHPKTISCLVLKANALLSKS